MIPTMSSQLLTPITFILIATIGYFLRILHSDSRQTIKEVSEMQGQLKLIKQEADSKIDKLASVTQFQIQKLTDGIFSLTQNVSQTNKSVNEMSILIMKVFDEIVGGKDKG